MALDAYWPCDVMEIGKICGVRRWNIVGFYSEAGRIRGELSKKNILETNNIKIYTEK